ncbi:MAG: hypothetical protein ACE5PO_07125 [Candidatus Bathyarchaeia archaeon]
MLENKIALIAWHIGLSTETFLLNPAKPLESEEIVKEINDNLESSQLSSDLEVSADEVSYVVNILTEIGLLSRR